MFTLKHYLNLKYSWPLILIAVLGIAATITLAVMKHPLAAGLATIIAAFIIVCIIEIRSIKILRTWKHDTGKSLYWFDGFAKVRSESGSTLKHINVGIGSNALLIYDDDEIKFLSYAMSRPITASVSGNKIALHPKGHGTITINCHSDAIAKDAIKALSKAQMDKGLTPKTIEPTYNPKPRRLTRKHSRKPKLNEEPETITNTGSISFVIR